jgi:hypothetical protein
MVYKIQSVIIPKSKFTEKSATEWIKKKDFTDKGKRIKNYKTTNFYRFRQVPPSHFDKTSFRTRKLKNGIELIMGKITK